MTVENRPAIKPFIRRGGAISNLDASPLIQRSLGVNAYVGAVVFEVAAFFAKDLPLWARGLIGVVGLGAIALGAKFFRNANQVSEAIK